MKRLLNSLYGWLVLWLLASSAYAGTAGSLLLLLPDGQPSDDPRVAVWLDAAREEGLQVQPIADSAFIALGAQAQTHAGVILPDQVHVRADDTLLQAVRGYVQQGGTLLLVYDAAALTADGFYSVPRSRLSDLAGIDYVLYDALRERTIGFGPVVGMRSALAALQVPPGKSMPAGAAPAEPCYLASDSDDPGGLKRNALPKPLKDHLPLECQPGAIVPHGAALPKPLKRSGKRAPAPIEPPDQEHTITGYVYGQLSYPSFVTQGASSANVLLGSPTFGMVAGLNHYGAGRVLFVNTPLGYLKATGTDGMLLHGVLRHLGHDLLALPYLAALPDGRPGMVLNWHVDAADALDPVRQLRRMQVWTDGPFSIHVTAGPDTIVPGDGLGIDLDHNRDAQSMLRRLAKAGHAVGSHGGWIHDYFGALASEDNAEQFLPLLDLNKAAVELATGLPILEYSAPQGNTPQWSVDWMEANGVLAYYWTGDSGMAPTRAYRAGSLRNSRPWAMQLTTYGDQATFEEFDERGLPQQEVSLWLQLLSDFVVHERTTRLIYLHPPGALLYPQALTDLLARARAYQRAGQFKWYTMTELARFLNARGQVAWNMQATDDGNWCINATHPVSLTGQTFVLPSERFERPELDQESGKDAKIGNDGLGDWLVIGQRGNKLYFCAKPRKD